MAKQSMRAKTPPPPAKAAPGRNGYTYREQFAVVVVCKDATHQERLYTELKAAGHKVKVVCV